MAVPLEKFVQQLEECGVLDRAVLQEFLPPRASPASAEGLALELVRQKKLTKFQVEEISRGRGRSLLLGNYILLSKIGEGGMGQVFKARHRVMDRLVAVKVLPGAMTQDPAALSRFQREVKAAARLNHPNIVTAHDADQAGGVHFLVMELVPGTDLSAFVKKNGPLSTELAVNFLLQAAKGLEYAHKNGVVHRDIKPANLLLDADGNIKILDMGLARMQGDAAQADLTGTGTVMGTVDYMAPEQAVDTKSADARADIYALGCSLHYLLSGRAAYDGETLVSRLLAHRDQPIPRLGDLATAVPDRLEAVFRKMVAKRVEDRYQTVTELIPDLESCAADPQLIREGRGRSPVILEKTFTGSTSSMPLLNATRLDVTSGQTLKEPLKGKHRRPVMVMGGAVLGAALLVAGLVLFTTKAGNSPTAGERPVAEGTAAEGNATEKTATEGQVAAIAPPPESVPVSGKRLGFETTGFDQWVKETAALPAPQQLEAVSRKLRELNPGFDGTLVSPVDSVSPPVVEGDRVAFVEIPVEFVTDLSPLRVFSGITLIQFRASPNAKNASLLNLSPLKGMVIHELSVFGPVDLATIKGVSISNFRNIGSVLSDLTPLSGMPLKELGISGNWEVKSLEPLKGMPLISLGCDNCQVTDLSPLRGMKLVALGCQVTGVADLSPLRGMPLEYLNCEQTRITDLSPLEGMKLKEFTFTPQADLKGVEIVRQMDSLALVGTAYGKMLPAQEFWKKYDAGEFANP